MSPSWGKISQSRILLGALLLISSSCGIATKSSNVSAVTALSSTDQTNAAFVFGIYKIDTGSHESAYIGTLVKGPNGIEWPSSMNSYFSALTAGSNVIQYIVKAYAPSPITGTNGDFYYEAPVTGKSISFNGAETAVWWAVKQSMVAAGQPTRLTQTSWENLLFVLDSYCPNCLLKSGSASYRLIAMDPTLRSALSDALATSGSASLSSTIVSQGKVGVAYSSPSLLNGTTSLSSSQGNTVSVQAVFYDPFASDTPGVPTSWSIQTSGGPSPLALPNPDNSKMTYFFDYTVHGSETITAGRTGTSSSGTATFAYNVAINELPPVYNGPLFTPRANHLIVIDLATYTTDPQLLPMTYTLTNAPTGVTLVGSKISWNPTQEPLSQVGPASIIVQITDTDGNATAAAVMLNVLPDHYPEFATLPPTPWNLSEGSLGTLSFSTQDVDGDPIEITCTDSSSIDCIGVFAAANPDGTLVPAGSNWPNISAPNPAIYTGTLGSQSVSIPFIPSYRQTIGTNASYSVQLKVNYPVANGLTLRKTFTSASKSVTINIQNIADPPTWGVQPGPNPVPAPVEIVAMNPMAGGSATDAAINPGPHTITYSIDPTSVVATPGTASNCSWITVNPVTAQITGTPPYTSAGTCKFAVKATDPLGIYTDSALQTLTITNVPRPITATGSIPAQNATELVLFTLDLSPYFNDPDLAAGDPRESISYVCPNCAALGISGYFFSGATFNWNAPIGTTTTTGSILFSGIQVKATNVGGFNATQNFDLTVHGAPGPMVIGFANDTLAVNAGPPKNVNIISLATGSIKVTVSNLPGDTSNYPYSITANCGTNCSVNFQSLSSNSGSGAAIFTLNLAPTALDGYAGIAATQNVITLNFNVASVPPNPTLASSASIQINVITIDRPATGLSLASDAGIGPMAVSINGSVFSPNNMSMQLVSPDVANDLVTYSFKTTTYPAFGTITGGVWSFNPLGSGCVPGSSTTTKTFEVTGTSTRTPTVTYTRTVTATINNALLGVGGSCPY